MMLEGGVDDERVSILSLCDFLVQDAPLRWIAAITFLAATSLFVLVLIILIAVD